MRTHGLGNTQSLRRSSYRFVNEGFMDLANDRASGRSRLGSAGSRVLPGDADWETREAECFRQMLTGEVREPDRFLQSREFLDLSGAVAELFHRDSQVPEQRKLQICQRRVIRINEMSATLDRSRASPDHHRRQGAVRMAIAVADAGAI